MNGLIRQSALLALLTILLTGCEAVEGIFKAGMWVGIVTVVIVLLVVVWAARRIKH